MKKYKAKIKSTSLKYIKLKDSKELIMVNLEFEFYKTKLIRNINFNFIQTENRLSKFILILLKIANVKEWEKLIGKYITIVTYNNQIIAIESLKEDLNIIFDEFFSGE